MVIIPKRLDLVGKKFNRLTVLEFYDVQHGMSRWRCRCDCGNEVIAYGRHMISGNTKSCGCLHWEERHTYGYKHGGSHKRLYAVWADMKTRCNNPNNVAYRWYGGKGVNVCDEWMQYPAFEEWATANGYDDTLTIDRIDPDGGYCPENCQWLPFEENHKRMLYDKSHARKKVAIDPDGNEYEFYVIADFAREHGLRQNCISGILNGAGQTHKGWKFRYAS